jgi:hypothetical protein
MLGEPSPLRARTLLPLGSQHTPSHMEVPVRGGQGRDAMVILGYRALLAGQSDMILSGT